MVTPCIDIEGLRFSYDQASEFLIDRLQLEKGSHCFLEGCSGSGKSTFLGLVSGILRPKAGKISVLGEDLKKLSPAKLDAFRAKNIGYIFQRFNLIPHLSVLENIRLAGFFKAKNTSPQPSQEEEKNLLSALGIENIAHKKAGEISVGQAQRAAAARALAQKPELLLADEPTSSLDQPMQKAFMDVLLGLAKDRQTTVVFVSHNPQLAPMFTTQLKVDDFLKVSTV